MLEDCAFGLKYVEDEESLHKSPVSIRRYSRMLCASASHRLAHTSFRTDSSSPF